MIKKKSRNNILIGDQQHHGHDWPALIRIKINGFINYFPFLNGFLVMNRSVTR